MNTGRSGTQGAQSLRKGASTTSRGGPSQKVLSAIRSSGARRGPPPSATTGGRRSAGARLAAHGGLAQRIHSSPLVTGAPRLLARPASRTRRSLTPRVHPPPETDAFGASAGPALRRTGSRGPEASPSLAWGPKSDKSSPPQHKLSQADSTLRRGGGRRDDPRALAAAATAALGRSVLHRPEHALPSRLDPAVWCDPKRQAATDSGLRSMPYHLHQLEVQVRSGFCQSTTILV